jgi:hypothetical protein
MKPSPPSIERGMTVSPGAQIIALGSSSSTSPNDPGVLCVSNIRPRLADDEAGPTLRLAPWGTMPKGDAVYQDCNREVEADPEKEGAFPPQ